MPIYNYLSRLDALNDENAISPTHSLEGGKRAIEMICSTQASCHGSDGQNGQYVFHLETTVPPQ
jgi:hypothetical protein